MTYAYELYLQDPQYMFVDWSQILMWFRIDDFSEKRSSCCDTWRTNHSLPRPKHLCRWHCQARPRDWYPLPRLIYFSYWNILFSFKSSLFSSAFDTFLVYGYNKSYFSLFLSGRISRTIVILMIGRNWILANRIENQLFIFLESILSDFNHFIDFTVSLFWYNALDRPIFILWLDCYWVLYCWFVGKVVEHLSLDTGSIVLVTGGRSTGRVGTLVHREKHPGTFDIVHIKDASGIEVS